MCQIKYRGPLMITGTTSEMQPITQASQVILQYPEESKENEITEKSICTAYTLLILCVIEIPIFSL